MNQNWNCSLWELMLRTLWLLLTLLAIVGALRLMGWADTGARELPDNTVLPSERAKDINYGKP